MKIVIAPDSFKESLSASEVAQAIGRGITAINPAIEIVELPMADGGEGTLDAIMRGTGGEIRTAQVTDALGRPCVANWGWVSPSTAFIEMASAAGLEQIAESDRNIMRSNTQGVGQLILKALDAGAKSIVLTVGGSATNDAGAGMLSALGIRFLNKDGQTLAASPQHLADLTKIDASGLDPRLNNIEWTLATDVDNPLCGEQGASTVFGPQKGAQPNQVKILDRTLEHFSSLAQASVGADYSGVSGAGAGGGIGFAAMAWFGAKIRPGAALVAEMIGLKGHIEQADLVITGEGRMDSQTLHGKAPMAVIRTAQTFGIPVIALAGALGDGYTVLYEHGLTAAFSLTSGPMSLDDACANAAELLEQRASDITRVMRLGADVWPTNLPS